MLDFLIYKEKVIKKQLMEKDRLNDYHSVNRAVINTKAILDSSEKINKELFDILLTLNTLYNLPDENTGDRLTSLIAKMKYFSRDWNEIESWSNIIRFG
jgi:hypothetical protein